MFTIHEIAAATEGAANGNCEQVISGISSDSRSIVAGQLFIPLSGGNFNGHDFISNVAEKGVTSVIVEEQWHKDHTLPDGVSYVVVKNSLKALGDIAAYWRLKFDIPVIAVTGSNGKTTVKEMIASILQIKGNGLKTAGNLNNLIGLPHMVLQLTKQHHWAVFEMGMSEPGEIDRLAAIAAPRVGIVLNALPAHLQSMGTVEAVAAAKGELLHRISDGGLAVVNADDSRVASLSQNASARRISFGIDRGEVRAREIEPNGLSGQHFVLVTPHGETAVTIKACGRHNIYNALAAAAALLEKVDLQTIKAGLESFTSYKGRFQIEEFQDFAIIDDSYNANPASVKAGLTTLEQIAGNGHRIAVLGDMLELGTVEKDAHTAVGVVAGRSVDRLYLLGPLMTENAASAAKDAGMEESHIICAENHSEIAALLHKTVKKGDVILIKGSRGMTMEKVALELKKLRQN